MSFETVARQTLYRQVARAAVTCGRWPTASCSPDLALRRTASPQLGAFLAVSVVSAVLGLATPLLAGNVVDEIGRGALGVVVALQGDRGVAVAPRRISLVTRWLSSNIGEGLILDLRTAVFDHVQRMPIAFFTRTNRRPGQQAG